MKYKTYFKEIFHTPDIFDCQSQQWKRTGRHKVKPQIFLIAKANNEK